jgi:hypothetical protein
VGEWANRQRRVETATAVGTGESPPARKIARLLNAAHDHLSKSDAIMGAQNERALPCLAGARSLRERFTDTLHNGKAEEISDG